MCEMLQKMQDASTTVIHICFVHVYIEKYWQQKSSALELKNVFCVNGPLVCPKLYESYVKISIPKVHVWCKFEVHTLMSNIAHNPLRVGHRFD